MALLAFLLETVYDGSTPLTAQMFCKHSLMPPLLLVVSTLDDPVHCTGGWRHDRSHLPEDEEMNDADDAEQN